MRRRAVITLTIVLHRELPVARDGIVLPMRHPRVLQPIWSEWLREIVLDGFEGRRMRVEIDEDQPGEHVRLQAPQAEGRMIEVWRHVGGFAQGAIEAVRPPVIATDEVRFVPGRLVADARSAMPAYVQQRV